MTGRGRVGLGGFQISRAGPGHPDPDLAGMVYAIPYQEVIRPVKNPGEFVLQNDARFRGIPIFGKRI